MNALRVTTALGAILVAGLGTALYVTTQNQGNALRAQIAQLESQLAQTLDASDTLSALDERLSAMEAHSGDIATSSDLSALRDQADQLSQQLAQQQDEIASLSSQQQQMPEQQQQSASEVTVSTTFPADIGAVIDDHIMQRPIIIEEALAALEQSRMQTAIATIIDNPVSPVMGNPEGDVTLIEFFDYNCGFCRQMGSDLRQMIENDPNLKVVMVELPILSQQSQDAARISLAAYRSDPSKYEKFHFELMLGNARVDGGLAENVATLNLYDIEEVQALSRDPITQMAIQSNYGVMDALGISGTPALYVDGQMFRGRTSRAELEAAVANARQATSTH